VSVNDTQPSFSRTNYSHSANPNKSLKSQFFQHSALPCLFVALSCLGGCNFALLCKNKFPLTFIWEQQHFLCSTAHCLLCPYKLLLFIFACLGMFFYQPAAPKPLKLILIKQKIFPSSHFFKYYQEWNIFLVLMDIEN
jgi:hypothetical protein